MPLIPTILGNELARIEPTDNELQAISAFAGAFETYFRGATVLSPAVPAPLMAARKAMEGTMVGLSKQGMGLNAIQIGIMTFWNVACASSAAVWPGTASPAILPPGIGGIAAAVGAVAPASANAKLNVQASWQAIALAIHSLMLGGIAMVITPVALVPTPIL